MSKQSNKKVYKNNQRKPKTQASGVNGSVNISSAKNATNIAKTNAHEKSSGAMDKSGANASGSVAKTAGGAKGVAMAKTAGGAKGVAKAKAKRAKGSRTKMELLITSAKPVAMMFGKVIASCIAGFIQIAAIFGASLLCFNINNHKNNLLA